MEENKKNTSREASRTGAENRKKEKPHKGEDTLDQHRAEMDGNVGKFEDEHTRPTGRTSALPGADEDENVGTASTGAGLGGNKGTGTRKKDEFQ